MHPFTIQLVVDQVLKFLWSDFHITYSQVISHPRTHTFTLHLCYVHSYRIVETSHLRSYSVCLVACVSTQQHHNNEPHGLLRGKWLHIPNWEQPQILSTSCETHIASILLYCITILSLLLESLSLTVIIEIEHRIRLVI